MNIQCRFRELLDVLPLHAEEGNIREVLAESELLSRLRAGSDDSLADEALVAIVRRVFQSMELLDPTALAEERWAFVSFPASLMARSVLETLATPGKTFFERGYWIQGGHRPIEIIEEQRQLLRRLEIQRTASPRPQVRPIRTVHVAWGIIRLASRFLMRRREDIQRPDARGYVFSGGRLDLTDLANHRQSPDALRDLFNIDSRLAKEAQPQTLARELREELGLLELEYQAIRQRTLAPFKMLEGTSNNLAYTQYNIAVFRIVLTREGELRALDRVSREPSNWGWFTASELTTGRTADGKSAFVDALVADLGAETQKFLVEEILDSSSTPPIYRTENDSIELPGRAGEALLKGRAGREKAFSFVPGRTDWQLLMVLGWHARGLRIQVHDNSIVLLGGGWMRLNDSGVLATAQGMAGHLEDLGFPVLETDTSGHCRLSLDANQVYFHPDCFHYSWELETPKKSIALTLKQLDTPWAVLMGRDLHIPLAPNFAKNIALVEAGKEPKGDFERESREHFEPARAIGLRKFISATKKAYEIVVPARASQ